MLYFNFYLLNRYLEGIQLNENCDEFDVCSFIISINCYAWNKKPVTPVSFIYNNLTG